MPALQPLNSQALLSFAKADLGCLSSASLLSVVSGSHISSAHWSRTKLQCSFSRSLFRTLHLHPLRCPKHWLFPCQPIAAKHLESMYIDTQRSPVLGPNCPAHVKCHKRKKEMRRGDPTAAFSWLHKRALHTALELESLSPKHSQQNSST